MLPDKQSHGRGIQINCSRNTQILTILEQGVSSEIVSAKKCHFYRSTRQYGGRLWRYLIQRSA